MEISKNNLRSMFPADKNNVSLSLRHEELKNHISTKLNADFHLAWIDVVCINKINYFSFIWTPDPENDKRNPKPPNYMIFYDLNPAQLESIYKELSIDQKWNIELIESYIKYNKPSLLHRRKSMQKVRFNLASIRTSNEEIRYICQFKYSNAEISKKTFNKLQHSLIDWRFDEVHAKTLESLPNKQNYMPIRLTRVLMNVNTINNKHYYYSTLYKPVNIIQKSCYDRKKTYDEDEFLIMDKIYQVRKNLTDQELVKTYEEFNKQNWRLIDLKALKDENSVTKFSTIWTCYESFYEGTSHLYIGLSKNELLTIIDTLKARKLRPKFVTNYGYMDLKGEHVYAVYFSQE